MSHSTKKPGASRMSTGLVALGSAAVFAVYAVGFLKTKAAADKFNEPRAPRRAAVPPGEAMALPAVAPAGATNLIPAVGPMAPASAPTVTLALPTTPVDRTNPAVASKVGSPGAPAAVAPVAGPSASTPPAAMKTEAAAQAASAPAKPAALPPALAAATTTEPASAPPPVATAVVAATPVPQAKYKDGTYTGWGSCRHGDIQAQVVVAAGRIASASIAQCLTRYSCSWISPLPPQVTQRQSPEVDYVSGATQSAVAFYDALVDALSKAK